MNQSNKDLLAQISYLIYQNEVPDHLDDTTEYYAEFVCQAIDSLVSDDNIDDACESLLNLIKAWRIFHIEKNGTVEILGMVK